MSDHNYNDQSYNQGAQYATFQAADGNYYAAGDAQGYYSQPSYQAGYQTGQPIQQYQTREPLQQNIAQHETEPANSVGDWFNFRDSTYLKGFALGAGIALVASNPTVQKAVVSGAVKAWAAVQGGFEEVKEQIQDAKAELSQQD